MSRKLESLLQFLEQSPTPFHAVENVAACLQQAGYRHVDEGEEWSPDAHGKYYFTRNDSSLIAADLGCSPQEQGFRLVGAHTDSPCLRIKPNAISTSSGYARLAVEIYGGVLLGPWFDRDLGIAGRVTFRTRKGRMESRMLDVRRAVAFVPSLAIHLDREVNDKRSINRQTEMPPLLCRLGKEAPDFDAFLAAALRKQYRGLSIDRILGFELSLYDLQPPALVGLEEEFLASARLDNLLSCHAGMEALLAAKPGANKVLVLNDHEEVGSASTSGAEGPFLRDVLMRLSSSEQSLARALQHSMLVSADNAHGVHPNYEEKHEPGHQPLMNSGPVIKINSNQRYATNSESAALFRHVCEHQRVPVQTIVVRSDMGCGSTIGPITATRLGVRTVDVGVPQLGMHSIRELAGVRDQQLMVKALKGFYELADWPF